MSPNGEDGDERGVGRRRFLQTTTGVALGSLVGFEGATRASATDSGGTAESGLDTRTATAGESLWSVDTESTVTAGPTVVDGTAYLGASDGTVSALDAETGAQQWETQLDGGVDAAPAVVGNTVFVGDSAGTISALTTAHGRLVWEFEADDSVLASPTVWNGRVVVGDAAGVVRAVDVGTGNEAWQFEAAGAVWSSVTVADGTAYVGCNADRLYALDATDGTERWQAGTDGTVDSSPTVVGDTVFVGSVDNNVYAFDATSGEQQWTAGTDDWVTGTPTATGETVVVGSEDNTVSALDVATGQRRWTTEADWAVSSSPTIADGRVFVGSDDHQLYALEADTGDVAWEYDTGARLAASPIVVDGVVFVAGADGVVTALEAGVGGSSDGSRVSRGTLGHHHEWASEAVDEATAITVNNEGASAWTVTAIDGIGVAAETGVSNPRIVFRPGARYTVENRGWSDHPFALVDENDDLLVSQSGAGRFADDPDVNVVSESEMLSFTLTPALADAVTTYVCTVHTGSMRGALDVRTSPTALPGETEPPQDLNDDGYYRDMNGDGRLSVSDLQLYFDRVFGQRESAYVQRNLAVFDYDDSGDISLNDVRSLFGRVVESDPDALDKLGIEAQTTDSLRLVDIEAVLSAEEGTRD